MFFLQNSYAVPQIRKSNKLQNNTLKYVSYVLNTFTGNSL